MFIFLPEPLYQILAFTWLLSEWIQSAKSSGWSETAHLGSSQLLTLVLLYPLAAPFPSDCPAVSLSPTGLAYYGF